MNTENLKREIGTRQLAAAIANIMVGAGIFVLPAIVAEKLGAAAICAYIVCGVAVILIALCFADVGSKVTTSGGVYAYTEKAFGPFAGFLSNNLFWLGSCVTSDAAVANALADSLKLFFPSLDNEIFRVFFFLILFGGLATINILGIKQGIRFVEIITLAKLIPLVLFVVCGFSFVSPENFHWTALPSLKDIGAASLILFFAFMGIEGAITSSGEIKNSSRTVPRGIFWGVLCVFVLYAAIQFTAQGILGKDLGANKNAPLAAASQIIFGKAGFTLILIATCISMFGTMSGEVLALPRILYAGAKDKLLPNYLSKVHPKYFTPHYAIATYVALDLLFAVFGGFKQLAILSSAATLLIYVGVVLATIKLRNINTEGKKTFSVPWGKTIPVLALVFIIALLSNLSKEEFIGITIFIFILSALYFFVKFTNKKNL